MTVFVVSLSECGGWRSAEELFGCLRPCGFCRKGGEVFFGVVLNVKMFGYVFSSNGTDWV
jgi:hypothetical protein